MTPGIQWRSDISSLISRLKSKGRSAFASRRSLFARDKHNLDVNRGGYITSSVGSDLDLNTNWNERKKKKKKLAPTGKKGGEKSML